MSMTLEVERMRYGVTCVYFAILRFQPPSVLHAMLHLFALDT